MDSEPSEILDGKAKDLTRLLGRALRGRGFKGHGAAYVCDREDGTVVVQLQRSARAAPAQLYFAVGIGVVCRMLLTFADVPSNRARMEDCHWRERVMNPGLSGKADWWLVTSETDTEELMARLLHALENGPLERAVHVTSAKALRDLWLEGCAPGLTDPERLLHLLPLLNGIGPKEVVPRIASELEKRARGTSFWPSAAIVLQQTAAASGPK